MEEKTKPQELVKRVQALLDELGLGTLTAMSWDSSNLVDSGEFYEYVIVQGAKKKN